MNSSRFRLVLLWLLLACVSSSNAPAGTNTATPLPNKCVVPIPRDGKAHERFLELNRRVEQSQGEARIVFIGDSITEGWEYSGRDVWRKYYAPRNALNLGISSDHTQHVLWRLQNGNLKNLNPKLAIVLIGVNNIPDETNTPRDVLDGVMAIVKCIRERCPATKILLLGIFPFREDFNPQRGRALQVNQALHKTADTEGFRFLDLGYLFLNPDGRIPREMMRDFLHPSPAAYRLWAQAMEPTVAELLGERPIAP